MRSRSSKHHMTGLTLLPAYKMGSLTLKKWTTQADGVAYPTALYFCLDNKEANTRLIFYELAAIQFRQMKTALQYVHMEGRIVLHQWWNKGGKQVGMRENISEEDLPPWVYVKYNIFPRIRKG